MQKKTNESCPCCSGKAYSLCCAPFHKGSLPGNALALMRSRYSAYALGLPDYIIHTTHPDNSGFQIDVKKWRQEIKAFSDFTTFQKLEILDFRDGEQQATVTFKAHLEQSGLPNPLLEKSTFVKVRGKWLYLNGDFS